MSLSPDLISQFVKTTKNESTIKEDTLLYGTIIKDPLDKVYKLKLDGSARLTPIDEDSSACDVKPYGDGDDPDGSRVLVLIKNHKASIIGNLSQPSARVKTVEGVTISAKDIEELRLANIEVHGTLKVQDGRIKTLETDNVKVNNTLTTAVAEITYIKTNHLTAEQISSAYATIEELKAVDLAVYNLEAVYGEFKDLTTDRLDAAEAVIDELDTTYANIDFSNIGKAAMEYLYSVSGLIENVTIGDGTITGNLVGVTIKGDVIEGNTIVADKLVIQGEDGLYYKLNLNGVAPGTTVTDYVNTGIEIDAVEGTLLNGVLTTTNEQVYTYIDSNGDTAYYCIKSVLFITTYYEVTKSTVEIEQTDYNSINGSIITAKSITATQISVDDLVAFDATIGGFTITDDAIYSNVKDSDGNTTRGTYIGSNGEVNFGDGNRFIKYYLDADGTWKLAIAADTILYDVNGSPHSLADLGAIGEYVAIGTYEDEPCIELGETDSDFKLLITNTRMLFMDGAEIIAHVSNQSLHIKKAVIEEELQQGEFVWKVRANGNMGLMWKGDM